MGGVREGVWNVFNPGQVKGVREASDSGTSKPVLTTIHVGFQSSRSIRNRPGEAMLAQKGLRPVACRHSSASTTCRHAAKRFMHPGVQGIV